MFQRSAPRELRLPLTPMIDCTFQLILFFLLAAQIAGEELPKLRLADPEKPSSAALADEVEQSNHVTVNVLTRYDGSDAERNPDLSLVADRYQVGIEVLKAGQPGVMSKLTTLLKSRRPADEQDDFWVEIRADRDIRYKDIEPVMQAASDAGIARMSLTAAAPPDGGRAGAEGE